MRRREFITLLGAAAVAGPRSAIAQQPDRMRRIGVLMGFAESDSEAQAYVAAFREGLQKFGWTDDRLGSGRGKVCYCRCSSAGPRTPRAAPGEGSQTEA